MRAGVSGDRRQERSRFDKRATSRFALSPVLCLSRARPTVARRHLAAARRVAAPRERKGSPFIPPLRALSEFVLFRISVLPFAVPYLLTFLSSPVFSIQFHVFVFYFIKSKILKLRV